MSTENDHRLQVQSFTLSTSCKEYIQDIKLEALNDIKICLPGSLIRPLNATFTCGKVAAQVIGETWKDYLWKILVYFPGKPTIGKTFTVIIPLIILDSLKITAKNPLGHSKLLTLEEYYYFEEECILEINGEGRFAALVGIPPS
ncbi:hypothetical protein H105_07931 [Trichophyton soudanense CBS 452.61]|uniref:Uncharacterized protein n=1 Tax=Trichophyton soudanense CBS 452.61 TaxID=1215331 RepID=A0A022XFZ7_TRISD|nr:hypothetical protein H105_07931 [Trichophyton soudanense CBS 452.61]